MQFKQLEGNAGDAFDIRTGVFKAPVAGLYHFNVLAISYADATLRPIVAITDMKTKAVLARAEKTAFHRSVSLATTLMLQEGQEIAANFKGQVTSVPAGSEDPEGQRHCQFSGFLVQQSEL
jgi:hypothetical protein